MQHRGGKGTQQDVRTWEFRMGGCLRPTVRRELLKGADGTKGGRKQLETRVERT